MGNVVYDGLTFEPFITREKIAARVIELAQELRRDISDDNPLFVCVLNGSFIFAADLFRACDFPDAEITFIRLKSYEGTASTGQVKQVLGLNENVEGRTVVIIEDIVDTSVTAVELRRLFEDNNAKSVKMVTLLFKPSSLKCGKEPEYVGFAIPPAFVLGYGLDIDEKARGLSDIYALKKD